MQSTQQAPVPTLAAVSESYAQWRASGHSKRNTPERLQRLTVALLQHHPTSVVCRSLKISHSALKKWLLAAECENTPSVVTETTLAVASTNPAAFVQLPDMPADLPPSASASNDQASMTSLRITLPNGTALSATIPARTLMMLINQPVQLLSSDGGQSV